MDYKLTFYILKQDIRIYVHSNRSNGWTKWAAFFCHGQNKSRNYQVFNLNTVPGVD